MVWFGIYLGSNIINVVKRENKQTEKKKNTQGKANNH